jgi:hypothetical protein
LPGNVALVSKKKKSLQSTGVKGMPVRLRFQTPGRNGTS